MTERHRPPPSLRDLAGLIVALSASASVNLLLGRAGLAAARASARPMDTAGAFVVLMFFVVPAVAGVLLGVIAAHPMRLVLPLVALSLAGTYLTLGSAGMPHGWKILEYAVQSAVIAGSAALVAAYRNRAATPTSAR